MNVLRKIQKSITDCKLQMQVTRMRKEFIKTLKEKLEEYQDLYLKRDTLTLTFQKLLKTVFENLSFRSCKYFFQSLD